MRELLAYGAVSVIGLAVVAGAAVRIVRMALDGTTSGDRAEVLRATAEVVLAICGRRKRR